MSDKNTPIALFWHRRDLRLHDNTGLQAALKGDLPVQPVFIFDRAILDKLDKPNDARVEFIHQAITSMQQQLQQHGATLHVFYGTVNEAFTHFNETYNIQAVYTNHDYEPYATQRDEAVRKWLEERGIAFHTFKDHVIKERDEVLSQQGRPYTVFTPYSKNWRNSIQPHDLAERNTEQYMSRLLQQAPLPIPSLEEMGFAPTGIPFPKEEVSDTLVQNYAEQRNLPAVEGTSRLGVHLRFGTVSIRQLAHKTWDLSDTFISELIWRDFYHQILFHQPQVVKQSFKTEYDHIAWRNNEEDFARWCQGKTGYPLVDAGMRQLNATGWMHNRVRMVVASFLCKHLLIHWSWGEAYFAKHLLDFDLAANNGGWQWAAGSGTDAAPYFRVFNPSEQAKKFDPSNKYIKQWVPEFQEFNYRPMVDHVFARNRALEVYGKTLKKS